jgi:long-chain acyl-CoA synthetase
MNVVDYLLDNGIADDQVALLTLGADHSYGQLRHAIGVVASHLVSVGAKKGDRVLLMAENSFFWVVSYLGVLRAGCTVVPIAPAVKSAELEYVITSCMVKFGFVHGRISREQLAYFPPGSRIVLEELNGNLGAAERELVHFRDLLESHRVENLSFPPIHDETDVAAIMFTSGSTNRPRGVIVSHLNIIANTSSIVEYLALTPNDRIMVVLPFYYCFGTSLLHTHLRAGGSLVIDTRFMFPDKVLVRMQETKCSGFAGVPSHYQLLLRKSNLKKMQFPALRYVQQAGGKLSDSLIQELREAIPAVKLFVMYGQTEATARLSYLPPELLDRKAGSIGRGIPGTRLRVLDKSGAPVMVGEIGEIVAEGKNITLGYWNAQDETDLTFRNGRLHTGDLAKVDDDGYIFVVDRSKDILKCGGKRYSCKEVEEMLMEFDGLVEAAVIGIPDELLGEAVKAFVVPQQKDERLVDRLHSFCLQRLPAPLIPKQIVVLDEIPKNTAGKIMKPALRSMN